MCSIIQGTSNVYVAFIFDFICLVAFSRRFKWLGIITRKSSNSKLRSIKYIIESVVQNIT